MKRKIISLFSCLLITFFFFSCSDLVNEMEGTTKSKSSSSVNNELTDSVDVDFTSPSDLKNETLTITSDSSSSLSFDFDENGTSGTVTQSGQIVATFEYDGDLMTITYATGDVYTYTILYAGGEYYLGPADRLKNSTGKNLPGKWIWENGTPVHPNPDYYWYDYYILYEDGRFTNSYYEETQPDYFAYWHNNGGFIEVTHADGTSANEEEGVVVIYDGKYIYLQAIKFD